MNGQLTINHYLTILKFKIMKKQLLKIALVLVGVTTFAQVGINNSTPKATLDVTAKTNDGSKAEGIIAPRLTGEQIKSANSQYGTAQKGTLIYATAGITSADVTGKTTNISAEGYYYFDGNLWQKVIAGANSFDTTNDAFVNDATNTMVKLGTNADGITTRSAGTDFVIKDTGNVGIGTSSPGNLLEISSSSSNTGLKLPYGAAAGKILTSDDAGNSSWQTSNSVFIYSEVHSTGTSTSFLAGSIVNFFHTIMGENIKTIYGNSYGWIDATQRWVAPYTGKYRVTTNMYFNPFSPSSSNPRLYALVNGTSVCNVTSATNNGLDDGTAYTSAIVSLNQGDYIQWVAQASAVLYGGDYHTFIRVESVE